MMMARGLLSLILALFALFGYANSTNSPSLSACHCRPVINVAVDGNQCDLCAANKQLLQKLHVYLLIYFFLSQTSICYFLYGLLAVPENRIILDSTFLSLKR